MAQGGKHPRRTRLDTLLVEQWGSDYRVLRGKKVGDGMVELIPGS